MIRSAQTAPSPMMTGRSVAGLRVGDAASRDGNGGRGVAADGGGGTAGWGAAAGANLAKSAGPAEGGGGDPGNSSGRGMATV